MSGPSLLGQVAPRSPRHVLEDLAARGERAVAGGKERPQVSLELASGRQLQGRVVAVGDDGGLPMVLLHTGGSERAPQVMHVRADHVVAVSYDVVKEAPPDRAAPGRLEIARLLTAAAEELAGPLGRKLEVAAADPLDEAQRHAVAALVPTLRQALVRLAGDEMGREALSALGALRIGAASQRGAVKASNELHVDAPLPPGDEWTTAELQAALEKAL